MYIYIYTRTRMYTCEYIYVYIHLCVYIYIRVCHACNQVYSYTSMKGSLLLLCVFVLNWHLWVKACMLSRYVSIASLHVVVDAVTCLTIAGIFLVHQCVR